MSFVSLDRFYGDDIEITETSCTVCDRGVSVHCCTNETISKAITSRSARAFEDIMHSVIYPLSDILATTYRDI